MPINIIVVEDESAIAVNIAQILRKSGYEVCALVASGEDALREARQHRPDLVLMDIRLAGEMDGLTAAALIRDSLATPVVYLTAHSDQDTIDRAKVTMPYGYLVKPFREAALLAAVEVALYRASHENRSNDTDKRTKGGREAASAPEGLSPRAEKVQDLLRRTKFLSTLSEATIALLAKSSREQSFRTNAQILVEGDKEAAGFILLSGRVALVKSSESGRELIVELLLPGDPLALAAISNSEYCPYTFKAQSDSTIIWIRRSQILLMFDECPELSRALLRDLFSRLGRSHSMSRSLAHDTVKVRVAAALSTFVPQVTPRQSAQLDTPLTINITRSELADIIGAAPETVIRSTKAMERDGLLDLSRSGRICILDSKRLLALAEGDV